MRSIEICAGAGGQALGLEQAGFEHVELVEIDQSACETLKLNRPAWLVQSVDVRNYQASAWKGVELFAGGVPCPPFSHAGKQLGPDDERDLFPEALRLVDEARPLAIMLENVRGLLDHRFYEYRSSILNQLKMMGYIASWQLLQASDYGVPQLRPRSILVALKPSIARFFSWPEPNPFRITTVGESLKDLMAQGGWEMAEAWSARANGVGPTLVGGSKKHGGPDLGPTRARMAWESLGVNGRSLADAPPDRGFSGLPRLTVRMAARIQGFPDDWVFSGKKTAAYRQIGNAFPPPVAFAVGRQISLAFQAAANVRVDRRA